MVEVKFHDIGEGMTEGEIVSYLVKVGDMVNVDQPLVEMQTDKMVAEIPSPTTGIIKSLNYEEGTTITIGSVLLEIDDGKEDSQALSSEKEVSAAVMTVEKKEANPDTTIKKQPPKRIIAAPHTRRIARENNVNIEEVVGSGPAGRVTDEDIFRFIREREGNVEQTKVEEREVIPIVESPKTTVGDMIPFTGIRKQIAVKMTESLSTIPHVTHFDEADLTNLLLFRQELKETGTNVSVVAFFLKALALTLKEFPLFNAQLDDKNQVIRLLKDCHIGLATNTERGLLVPVLREVDKKSIHEIHDEMKTLTKKAQEQKLTAAEMKGGTFTISNVGPLGGMAATPIINHPQTSIIAFHKTRKMPVVMGNDEIAIRSIMTMSLSFDHRIIDGADAVMFTNRFIELIEQPKKLLLYLR